MCLDAPVPRVGADQQDLGESRALQLLVFRVWSVTVKLVLDCLGVSLSKMDMAGGLYFRVLRKVASVRVS